MAFLSYSWRFSAPKLIRVVLPELLQLLNPINHKFWQLQQAEEKHSSHKLIRFSVHSQKMTKKFKEKTKKLFFGIFYSKFFKATEIFFVFFVHLFLTFSTQMFYEPEDFYILWASKMFLVSFFSFLKIFFVFFYI